MREIQLALNQTQKIRLKKALQQLDSFYSNRNSNASVTVADTIPINYEDSTLKGHGTLERDGEVVATLCGIVERVNKLVYIRTLRARYKPDVGDIVVGRVVEVAQKRWKLEINFSQDAVLMLSSMNLPDGIQRRRTAVDELNMRSIFEENDVVCAEVRNFQHDGSIQLQARSQKYGKLEKGQLLRVPPYLVKRQKHHFNHLVQQGVDLILGCNGFIWVGEHVDVPDTMAIDQIDNSDGQNATINKTTETTPLETRQNICRIANAVRVLSTLGFNLTLDVILESVKLSTALNLDIEEMLGPEFHVLVAEKEVERRMSLTRKRFHPSGEELIVHYLQNKASSWSLPASIIADTDLYKYNPWELPKKTLFGDDEWFFFSPRYRKYLNGARLNRSAGSGYWKGTGIDRPILTSSGSVSVGVKKSLVFYKGRPPKGLKTEWVINEYRLLDITFKHSRSKGSMRVRTLIF